jgi:hypothetical protein
MGSKGMPCTYATICGKSDREEDRLILSDGDSDASAPSGCACLSTFSKNEEKKGPWADRERYLDCPLVELSTSTFSEPSSRDGLGLDNYRRSV